MATVFGGQLNAISRGLRLHRAGMKVLRGGSSLPEWTPIYDGLTTFGELYNQWQPSGNNWEVEVTYFDAEQSSTNRLLSGVDFNTYVTSAGQFGLQADLGGGLKFFTNSFSLQGFVTGKVSVGGGNTDIINETGAVTRSEVGSPISNAIGYIGSTLGLGGFFKGQIQRIKLLDNYDTGRTEYPVNGRDVVPLDGLTQYGEIPAWTPSNYANNKVSCDFLWDGSLGSGNVYILSTSAASNPRFFINSSTGVLRVLGYSEATLNGLPVIDNTEVITPNKVYSISGRLTNNDVAGVGVFGSTNTDQFSGFLANIRLTDLDNPSNSRHYPLDRADIIQDVNEPDFPELVVNGDFEDGANGWELINTVVTGSRLSLPEPITDYARARQEVTLTAGTTYELSFNYYNKVGAIRITLLGLVDFPADSSIGDGFYRVAYTPSADYIGYLDVNNSDSNSAKWDIDNISVRETTQGNWINAPQAVYRPNNSIDINTVKRSKDVPSASDNLLINSLGSVGEELVVNGDFEDGESGWNPEGGWVLSEGAASYNSAVAYRRFTSIPLPVKTGAVVEVTVDATITSGTLQYYMNYAGGILTTLDLNVDASGMRTYTFQDIDPTRNPQVYIRSGGAGANATVNSVSVRETTRNIGQIKNLTGYQPVLKGGGLNRENVPDKFEAFNGDYTFGSFLLGVSTINGEFIGAQTGGAEASWNGSAGIRFPSPGDIVTSKEAVAKITVVTNASRVSYAVLQGTDEQIQKGFEYPNVFRVIKPTDTSGEYEHYNTGGSYPWIP